MEGGLDVLSVSMEFYSPTSLTFTLGQIAGYMLDEKRKYGFLTTYEQTIFLKQEQVGEEWVLFVSHVFKHTIRSIGPRTYNSFLFT